MVSMALRKVPDTFLPDTFLPRKCRARDNSLKLIQKPLPRPHAADLRLAIVDNLET
jgi:hypothetical protein